MGIKFLLAFVIGFILVVSANARSAGHCTRSVSTEHAHAKAAPTKPLPSRDPGFPCTKCR